MPERKPLRENVARVLPLTRSRWSRWYVALVPEEPDNNSGNYEQRDDHDVKKGFIFKKIQTQFCEEKYDNGIYELSAWKRSKRGRKPRRYVVYIGRSHRVGPNSINERIREYLKDGSHLNFFIDRALSLDYKLSFRAKNIPGSIHDVKKCEKKYLGKYDYAWNDVNNGDTRENVPPP